MRVARERTARGYEHTRPGGPGGRWAPTVRVETSDKVLQRLVTWRGAGRHALRVMRCYMLEICYKAPLQDGEHRYRPRALSSPVLLVHTVKWTKSGFVCLSVFLFFCLFVCFCVCFFCFSVGSDTERHDGGSGKDKMKQEVRLDPDLRIICWIAEGAFEREREQ
jgi:hypothetical protein